MIEGVNSPIEGQMIITISKKIGTIVRKINQEDRIIGLNPDRKGKDNLMSIAEVEDKLNLTEDLLKI